ncbi:MAG: hypothetical protein K0Q79_2534 [Flavipsychrobacter sp.]|jgi:thioredoxin-related protein|nr:hypothetical protein [Flavipsychrobacter sp.]
MTRILLIAILILSAPVVLMADDKKKKTTGTQKPAANAPAVNTAKEEIHWISDLNELQAKMQASPKKVIIDVYTAWCGWCKKMDATTYENPDLIRYVNNNFYAVKLDAERQDAFIFQGKEYKFEPQYKANTFAVEIMKGSMSYPTTVFMVENFQMPTPIPGFRTVKEMELFLTYFGDNMYKRVKFDDYQKTFTYHWDKGQAPDMTAPAGH